MLHMGTGSSWGGWVFYRPLLQGSWGHTWALGDGQSQRSDHENESKFSLEFIKSSSHVEERNVDEVGEGKQ